MSSQIPLAAFFTTKTSDDISEFESRMVKITEYRKMILGSDAIPESIKKIVDSKEIVPNKQFTRRGTARNNDLAAFKRDIITQYDEILAAINNDMLDETFRQEFGKYIASPERQQWVDINVKIDEGAVADVAGKLSGYRNLLDFLANRYLPLQVEVKQTNLNKKIEQAELLKSAAKTLLIEQAKAGELETLAAQTGDIRQNQGNLAAGLITYAEDLVTSNDGFAAALANGSVNRTIEKANEILVNANTLVEQFEGQPDLVEQVLTAAKEYADEIIAQGKKDADAILSAHAADKIVLMGAATDGIQNLRTNTDNLLKGSPETWGSIVDSNVKIAQDANVTIRDIHERNVAKIRSIDKLSRSTTDFYTRFAGGVFAQILEIAEERKKQAAAEAAEARAKAAAALAKEQENKDRISLELDDYSLGLLGIDPSNRLPLNVTERAALFKKAKDAGVNHPAMAGLASEQANTDRIIRKLDDYFIPSLNPLLLDETELAALRKEAKDAGVNHPALYNDARILMTNWLNPNAPPSAPPPATNPETNDLSIGDGVDDLTQSATSEAVTTANNQAISEAVEQGAQVEISVEMPEIEFDLGF